MLLVRLYETVLCFFFEATDSSIETGTPRGVCMRIVRNTAGSIFPLGRGILVGTLFGAFVFLSENLLCPFDNTYGSSAHKFSFSFCAL